MDATTLRIVLLILGIVFLVAIYLYETRRRKRETAQARRRVLPEFDEPVISETAISDESDSEPVMLHESDSQYNDDGDTWASWDDEDTEQLTSDINGVKGMNTADDPSQEMEMAADESFGMSEQQELFSFSAQEESPVDVPKLIIQINLKAKHQPFNGLNIMKAMNETGLVLGKIPIYQRLGSDSRHIPQFNVASMVEPGTFPNKDFEQFETPGLTLFTQLPVPGDGMAVFSDMLFTAERLAVILDGELQDDTHSALTKQTIEHLRGQIMEHRRQIQLARSKG
jgi:cell division protein ZipA